MYYIPFFLGCLILEATLIILTSKRRAIEVYIHVFFILLIYYIELLE